MKARASICRDGDTIAEATGMLREALKFTLSSFEKQLDNGLLADIANHGEPVEYALSITPLPSKYPSQNEES